MILVGRIRDVMESWPLQLVVDSRNGRFHVGLRHDTQVTLNGRPGAPGDLQPGQRVRISGVDAGAMSMVAQTIDARV